jgi:uncharacterized membrane protein
MSAPQRVADRTLKTAGELLRFETDKAPQKTSRVTIGAFVLAAAVYVLMRLRGMTSAPPGFDEIFSLRAARESWRAMFAIIADDIVHPPLFYLLLKIWIAVGGHSLFWVRLLPVTLAIAALLPFVALCRELRIPLRVTTLAVALMSVNTYLIAYAQELRMYSLVMMLALCSLLFFVRFFNAPVRSAAVTLLLLTATNLLLVSAHYYAWAIVIIEFLFLLARGRRKLIGFTLGTLAIVFCYTPWLYVVARHALDPERARLSGNLTWLPRPSPVNFFGFYAALTGAAPYLWRQSLRLLASFATLAVFAVPALLLIWRDIMRRRIISSPAILLATVAFAPTLFVFLASLALPRSIWHQRYLIIVAVPYVLLVAVGLDHLRPVFLRSCLIVLALAWTAFAGFNEPSYSDKFEWQTVAEKLHAAETSPIQTTVYVHGGMIALPLRYYLAELDDTRFQVIREDDLAAMEMHGRFWFAYRSNAWRAQLSPQEIFRRRGFRIGTVIETGGETKHKVVMFPVEPGAH